MTLNDDMEKLTQAVQRFAKGYGEAITEKFRPFNEAVERARDQERERRRQAGTSQDRRQPPSGRSTSTT